MEEEVEEAGDEESKQRQRESNGVTINRTSSRK